MMEVLELGWPVKLAQVVPLTAFSRILLLRSYYKNEILHKSTVWNCMYKMSEKGEQERNVADQIEKRGIPPAASAIITFLKRPPIQCSTNEVLIGGRNWGWGIDNQRAQSVVLRSHSSGGVLAGQEKPQSQSQNVQQRSHLIHKCVGRKFSLCRGFYTHDSQRMVIDQRKSGCMNVSSKWKEKLSLSHA